MTHEHPSIVILDDDVQLRDDVIVAGLRHYGFQARGVSTAIELIKSHCDVAIVDINLPDVNGLQVIRYLRESRLSIVVIGLSVEPIEREGIEALRLGADIYLVKPVTIELLSISIHSVLRRLREDTHPERGSRWFLTANDGGVIALTIFERSMLRALEAARGMPLTRDGLIETIAGDTIDFDPHRLEMVVHRLRKKLLKSVDHRLNIITVRGTGYALIEGKK